MYKEKSLKTIKTVYLIEIIFAKTRKNAALLIGDLALSSESDAVFHAYQTEDTRFVKEAYLPSIIRISNS